MSELPVFYKSDDGQQTELPTYEALGQVQIILASAETGQVGPTLLLEGEHFTTEATPCHAWKPLNKAAAEKFDRWLESLPLDGKNISQEHINEAAYTLRPREGDPDFPMEQWWPAVLRLAASLSDKQKGRVAAPTPGFRPAVSPHQSPMPFASTGGAYPVEHGRAPPAQHQPQNPANAAAKSRAQRVRPPMPNAAPASSVQG